MVVIPSRHPTHRLPSCLWQVAAEVIMLWVKLLFFGLAIDGVGTFIFMTAELIKGLKYFIGLLATLFISFAVAFMVLFRSVSCGV